jgi:hypothetical protein
MSLTFDMYGTRFHARSSVSTKMMFGLLPPLLVLMSRALMSVALALISALVAASPPVVISGIRSPSDDEHAAANSAAETMTIAGYRSSRLMFTRVSSFFATAH